eukprot:CAMPEP_0176342030 /NCGR_PEP_ID=MMETSP0126-20121128/2856_1 /TAXON_ID=141414 ORGANISM="Strombidinopsis acuminatum, Strain SPMC142" /NCGR_SAMPLE_ID=MMETSP0126 /ASSEMBLY_ACC=CAM_ASM_000229 /LENGTH=108 /DNA_ID=CAMNT_0017687211 /DNA_START=3948 /DNA_END=4274 /DNA_ORIENTATION=-
MFDKLAKDVIHLVKIDPTKPFFDDITDLRVDLLECKAERAETIEDIDAPEDEITAASNMDTAYNRQGGNNNADLVNDYRDDDETDVFQVINTENNDGGADNESNQSFG